MLVADWTIYIVAAFLGSYIQSVTGFGLGMIVMAVVGANGSIPLPVLAAIVSLITALNIAMSLKGRLPSVDRRIFGWMAAGQVPAVIVGVIAAVVLDREARWVLELLLGLFIIAGSVSMLARPVARTATSANWACLCAGMSGGMMGGLFAASGPVLGWFGYRQPLQVAVIRATLLSSFALASVTRIGTVAVQGGITFEVVKLSLIAAPLVGFGAWLGRKRPPPFSDAQMKRSVFALLLVMGAIITSNAIYPWR